MSFLNFILAVAALVIAILAYRKAGGDTENMKEQVNSLRQRTAEMLEKMENTVNPEK